jgi:hypothetical protein
MKVETITRGGRMEKHAPSSKQEAAICERRSRQSPLPDVIAGEDRARRPCLHLYSPLLPRNYHIPDHLHLAQPALFGRLQHLSQDILLDLIVARPFRGSPIVRQTRRFEVIPQVALVLQRLSREGRWGTRLALVRSQGR